MKSSSWTNILMKGLGKPSNVFHRITFTLKFELYFGPCRRLAWLCRKLWSGCRNLAEKRVRTGHSDRSGETRTFKDQANVSNTHGVFGFLDDLVDFLVPIRQNPFDHSSASIDACFTYTLVFPLRTTRFTSSSSSLAARYGFVALRQTREIYPAPSKSRYRRFCSCFAGCLFCGLNLNLLFIITGFFAGWRVVVEKESVRSHDVTRMKTMEWIYPSDYFGEGVFRKDLHDSNDRLKDERRKINTLFI